MTSLILLDVRVDPVNPLPWTGLVVLLIVVFILAVSVVAASVAFLIWWKRKQIRTEQSVEQPAPVPPLI